MSQTWEEFGFAKRRHIQAINVSKHDDVKKEGIVLTSGQYVV